MVKSKKYYPKAVLNLGWGENSKLDNQRLELINKFSVGKKILDIGCGYGLYVDYLSSQGFDATGVDFVEEFIKSDKQLRRGTFVKGRAENLPFKDNLFDTVLLFDILEHGDDRKILKEAKRVSKDRILVIVPRKVDSQLEQAGIIFRHYLDKSHHREYEERDLKKLTRDCNLQIVNLQKVHPLYNETIFLSLFKGPLIFKKIIRKIVFLLLPKVFYPTEYFAVLEK